MLKSIAFLPAAVLVASSSAVAQTAVQPAPQPQVQTQLQPKPASNPAPALDPNRKICITEDVIGSRLGGTRICETAAQWERERKQGAGDEQ